MDGSSSTLSRCLYLQNSFVRLCCDYCHISVYFLKNQLAILVMKMEEKATFWTYYALLKKGKNTTETHTEYLCSVWRRCWDWSHDSEWFAKFHAAVPCWTVLHSRVHQLMLIAIKGRHWEQSACATGRSLQLSECPDQALRTACASLGYVSRCDVWVPRKWREKPSWPSFHVQFSSER